MLTTVNYSGKTFTIGRPAPLTYTCTLDNGHVSTITSDMDLDYEFEDNQVAWGQYLIETLEEAGVIVYSDILEDYCMADAQEEMEHETLLEQEWAAEHVRQESRQDLFI